MIRAVLDPGVLIAAVIAPLGVCGRLLQAALDGRYVIVVCPSLLSELEEVLLRPKFRRYVSAEHVRLYVTLMPQLPIAGQIRQSLDVSPRTPTMITWSPWHRRRARISWSLAIRTCWNYLILSLPYSAPGHF